MTHRIRSLWISYQLTPLFGMNLCGFESDRPALRAELAAVEDILSRQPSNSVLAVLDIAFTDLSPELITFIHAHQGQPGDPIRKLAIIGVSEPRRLWYRLTRKVTWPKHARFFEGHEEAKPWLIKESL